MIKIGVVVIDEVHSINLEQRGYVWEDIITQLNDNISFIKINNSIDGYLADLSNLVTVLAR